MALPCTPPPPPLVLLQVMEVLFNYKRTVEDFKKCGGKGGNPYGFPFVSECVGGGSFPGPCKDSAFPVPCGDGSCQSDYVSCLRAMSRAEAPGEAAGAQRWAAAEASARRGGGGPLAGSDNPRDAPVSTGLSELEY